MNERTKLQQRVRDHFNHPRRVNWEHDYNESMDEIKALEEENTRRAEQIQRMEDNAIKLIGNLQQAIVALLEIADYADKEPFDMRDLKLIAIASDCLGR